MTTNTYVVDEARADQRLDIALAALSGASRSQVRRWIDAGLVNVNDKTCRASQPVALGDCLVATPAAPLASRLEPEAIALDILHEDQDLIVIDKPAGLVMHPAPGHPTGTLVHALLYHCGDLAQIGGVERPGIVHRLDRGTSGVVVVAKCDEAHRHLSEQFHEHSISRVYRAVVRGAPGSDSGRIDLPIGRHRRDRKRMSVRGTAPRDAQTAWRIVERFARSQRSVLEVMPETGRTHQIRVHLSSVGLPIVGDPVYGKAKARTNEFPRPALHAAQLGFIHPRNGESMHFEAPLPLDMTELLATLARREGLRR